MKDKGVEQERNAEASRRTVELKRRALEMGFNAVGVASLEPNAHAAELDRWLAAGDAGTMPERELAQRAGLGWIGKNMMLIHPALGSFTFIGVVLTDADLAPDLPFEADRCGTCRRFLDACPTAAFVAPHVMDARRCISYLTIEHRADFTADERSLVGDWLFGCDICQDVCPWNVQFARATADPDLAPRSDLAVPDPHAFLELDEETFVRRYGDTALERPGRCGMRRNAAATLAPKAP